MQLVSRQKVSFQSEELKVVGNLFKPQNFKKDVLLPAILVAGAMTGVKEQVAGNYGAYCQSRLYDVSVRPPSFR